MTKQELIHFLEPFADDIQIITSGSRTANFMFEDIELKYEIVSTELRYFNPILGITSGDGVVVIRSSKIK